MNFLEASLADHLKRCSSAPFLFVGSGISRRYLELEDWEGLLRRFCGKISPFEYYKSSANGDLPTVASLMAKDFHEVWWKDDSFQALREKYKKISINRTSALRIAISEYLSELTNSKITNPLLANEVELFASLNVDGIITTNWDTFLEQTFPDYKVFIGQEQLLFSNPQSIAEIYKIHGCISQPNTLILTDEDYNNFNKNNTYLAAKLITLFIEHPIIFLGYNLSDTNITQLLKSIVGCLGTKDISHLRENLIFVNWRKQEEESYNKTFMTFDGIQVPTTIITTDSFAPIYNAINTTKRKIPARILSYCKNQLYELVKSTKPESKLCVADLTQIEKNKDIEFVVGVGVINEHLNLRLYNTTSSDDLFKNLILNEPILDPNKILQSTLPELSKRTKFLPTFKYLKEIGVTNYEMYNKLGINLDKLVYKTYEDFKIPTYKTAFDRSIKGKTLDEIIATLLPRHSVTYIPFLKPDEIDIDTLHEFLKKNFGLLCNDDSYASWARKLACLWDKINFGWD